METVQDKERKHKSERIDDSIARAYQELEQREPFRYDPGSDPVYAQLRRDYSEAGQQAMRNSMGQAAALTGGYGSSYSQRVGQQQAEAYLQRLSDVLPELYSAAYARYQDQGSALERRLELGEKLREGEIKVEKEQRDRDAAQLQEASLRAGYGDFSGFETLYGPQAAAQMRRSWAAANPTAAYLSGSITAQDYYGITGQWPYGYVVPGSGGGDYGGTGSSGSTAKKSRRITDKSVLKSKSGAGYTR